MIVQALPAHVYAVANDMRMMDANEVWALGQVSPLEAVRVSFEQSMDAWTWVKDGRAVAMWGVGVESIIGNKGIPWLLTTRFVEERPLEFLRGSKRVVRVLNARYPVLENWVDARYEVCIRWLKWLGFTVGDPQPYGKMGMLFHKFRMEA